MSWAHLAANSAASSRNASSFFWALWDLRARQAECERQRFASLPTLPCPPASRPWPSGPSPGRRQAAREEHAARLRCHLLTHLAQLLVRLQLLLLLAAVAAASLPARASGYASEGSHWPAAWQRCRLVVPPHHHLHLPLASPKPSPSALHGLVLLVRIGTGSGRPSSEHCHTRDSPSTVAAVHRDGSWCETASQLEPDWLLEPPTHPPPQGLQKLIPNPDP